jgi:hypothetical protein
LSPDPVPGSDPIDEALDVDVDPLEPVNEENQYYDDDVDYRCDDRPDPPSPTPPSPRPRPVPEPAPVPSPRPVPGPIPCPLPSAAGRRTILLGGRVVPLNGDTPDAHSDLNLHSKLGAYTIATSAIYSTLNSLRSSGTAVPASSYASASIWCLSPTQMTTC